MEEQQQNTEQSQVVTMGPEGKKPFTKRKLSIVLAVMALVIAVGAAVAVLVTSNSEDTTKQPAATTQKATVVVSMTDAGFVPATLTVSKGTTVVWKNDSQSPRQVGSNPYPDHSSLPGLYSKDVIAPGSTYEYTFTEAGTWGYADYTKPTLSATVIVQ